MSSGLLRYRSAPSSLIGEVCEDFLPVRPPASPDADTMFARFLSPDLRDELRGKPPHPPPGGGQRSAHFPPPSPHPPAAAEESIAMMYQQQTVATSMAMEAAGNCSNLIRHSSSPAGLFTHLNVDGGYGVMRGIAEGVPAGGRLKSQLSFSSRQSSAGLLSQISEIETESLGGGYHQQQMASWNDSPILSDNSFSSALKRSRDGSQQQQKTETQNAEGRNGLSHQFSLPKTSSEMAAIEKFLQFQDSVPCKIRAKRGCATHPRSIAERVRRTRISERMRKLQELVPNMDKQTNTADMLDLAVDYIKDLQKQVKGLSDSRANCTCSSSKQKPPYTYSTQA